MEMLFTILLTVWSKKENAVVIWWKKHLNKLVITKKDNKDFKNSTKCWICDNGYVNGDVKVRSFCHIISLKNAEALYIEV